MEKQTDMQELKALLEKNGVRKLYHFTDRDNLASIIRHGGLYSWADCADKGIDIPKPGSDQMSRSLDARDGLEHYVRVSFVTSHPMMFVAMNDGRISNPVILEVDPEVVCRPGTLFADRNATKNGARVVAGPTVCGTFTSTPSRQGNISTCPRRNSCFTKPRCS